MNILGEQFCGKRECEEIADKERANSGMGHGAWGMLYPSCI